MARCNEHNRMYCVADRCRAAERKGPYGQTVALGDPEVTFLDAGQQFESGLYMGGMAFGEMTEERAAEEDNPERGSQ